MDLRFSPEQDAFRAEVPAWLAEHVPEPGSLASLDTAEGFEQHRAWERTMADARLSVVSWPEPYGGRDLGIMEWLIFEEEYYWARAPIRVSQNGIFLLGPTMLHYGTEAQKARYLPLMARADEIWCQGWSEPDAGSDLAAIRSRAVRASGDDGWLLTGQKTWCSRGAFAEWCFAVMRTDPEAERHRGLTYFLVPMDAPGVTVRPIAQIDGETGFAEVFFEDVFVPDDQVLGGVGEGWRVAMSTAGSERGLSLRSPARYTAAAARLIQLYDTSGRPGGAIADEVARAYVDAHAYEVGTWWMATRAADGQEIGAESSVNKIFWSETDVNINAAAMRLLGPGAELLVVAGDGDAHPGEWLDAYLSALAGPIYAGANEIQRNVVAERLLGLPRWPAMRFAFTDDQLALRDAVRQVLDRECTAADLRAVADGVANSRRWDVLAELGAMGLLVDEAYGGLEMTEVELVGVLEEAGRAALPEPLAETAALAVPLLSDRSQLEAIAAGELAVGLGGVDVEAGGFRPTWQAGADGQVHTHRVVGASSAGLLLLWYGESGGPWELHGVAADAVTVERTPSIDATRDVATVAWRPEPSTVLFSGIAAEANLRATGDRAALAMSAQLLGLADRMLTLAAEYAKVRVQFGKPIGSFQAVKHHLANAKVRLDFARPVTYRAAYAVAHAQPDRLVHCSMAKALASDAADLAARVALQVHGAIGYTWECDLHFYMKRAWALSAAWGDAPTHRARVMAGALEHPGGRTAW